MPTYSKLILTNSNITGAEPLDSDLDYGELAINYNDGRLFYKDINDEVKIIALVDSFDTISNHIGNESNPHNVTKTQLGLSNVNNTSDANKPISTATQAALDLKADSDHNHVIGDITNLQTTLNSKAENSFLTQHIMDLNNPHDVTKAQVGLSNVDNTSDANKPISTATQTALDLKADKTYVDNNAVFSNDTRNIVTLTQAEYDELSPPDASTLYIISG